LQQTYDQFCKADRKPKKSNPVEKQEIDDSIHTSTTSIRWEVTSSQSMYILQVPNDLYHMKMAKIKQLSLSIMDLKEMVSA
jgi:hypothetical protein